MAVDMGHASEPFGQVFVSGSDQATVTLEATVPLVAQTESYSLDLIE